MLSMVFPMIRAKHFLEIRFADSMPMERVLKYVLILKGLFSDVDYTKTWLYSDEFKKAAITQRIELMLKYVMAGLTKEEAEYLKKE